MRVITLWFWCSLVFKRTSFLMQAKKCDIILVNDLTFKMAQLWTFHQDVSSKKFRGICETEETETLKLKSLDFEKYPVLMDFFSFIEIAYSMDNLVSIKRCCSEDIILTWLAYVWGLVLCHTKKIVLPLLFFLFFP